MGPLNPTVKLTLSRLTPVVVGLVLSGDQIGVDVRPQVLPLLAAVAAAEHALDPLLASEYDRFLHPSRDQRIAALYQELAELAETGDDHESEARRKSCLDDLRALQREEAAEFAEAARGGRAFDEASFEQTMRAAKELLSNHGDAAGPDEST